MHVPDDSVAAILDFAEREFDLVTFLRERAACGGWPAPVTPGDWLAWVLDEAEIQRAEARTAVDPAPHHRFASYLRAVAVFLDALGVTPASLPWRTAEGADA